MPDFEVITYRGTPETPSGQLVALAKARIALVIGDAIEKLPLDRRRAELEAALIYAAAGVPRDRLSPDDIRAAHLRLFKLHQAI